MTNTMITQMPKYELYKDSGVEWMGQIPEGWATKPLKFGATIVLGKMLCSQNPGGYSLRSYLKSKNIQWLKADLTAVDEMWFSKTELEMYRLYEDDLILSEGGEVGKACLWKSELEECYIQNSAHKVTMLDGNNPKYFLYQMFACGKYGHFDSIVNRVSIAHLTREKLANVKFLFPSLGEQKVIAVFLDKQTAQIDEAIAIKQKQIELLKERKQIIIQQAVTQGLNSDAPMKDSDVDWIGAIPKHWSVERAKYLLDEINERSDTGLEELLSVSHMTGVTPRSEKNVTMFMAENYTGSKLCHSGDLVINIMWAWMGALGVSDRTGIVSPSYGVFREQREGTFVPKYLEMLLKSTKYVEYYNKVSTGLHSSRLRFYGHMLFDMALGFPPYEEQTQIIEYISRECSKVDEAITVQAEQVSKLKEYKTTLINSAVTGKIKVTELA